MSKQKTNWILDAVLFIGFLMTFFLDLTGLEWHQWLGIFLGALALYHLLIHWKWVTAVAKRLTGNSPPQNRLYFLLDLFIFLIFILIGLTGLWISTWLNLDLSSYLFWKDLHIYSSIASLVLILIKIAVHWRWIVRTASKYFGLWKSPTPIGVLAGNSRAAQNSSLNRREFLQLMGIAGLASVISAANLVDFSRAAGQEILEEQTRAPELPDTDPIDLNSSQDLSCQPVCDRGCSYPGECRRFIDQDGNGICDLSECPTGESDSEEGPHPEMDQGSTENSSTELNEPVLEGDNETNECVVRCPKGCSYPGQCPDYVDLNANGLCDLGECLESNSQLENATSTHSGGGQRRRGKR